MATCMDCPRVRPRQTSWELVAVSEEVTWQESAKHQPDDSLRCIKIGS